MKLLVDTSILIALLASEEERNKIIQKIDGSELVCVESIKLEMGNALSAMFKKRRITLQQGLDILQAFQKIKIHIVPIDLFRSIEISHQYNIYAYDAYVLEAAKHLNISLITLDNKMKEIAQKIKIPVIEV